MRAEQQQQRRAPGLFRRSGVARPSCCAAIATAAAAPRRRASSPLAFWASSPSSDPRPAGREGRARKGSGRQAKKRRGEAGKPGSEADKRATPNPNKSPPAGAAPAGPGSGSRCGPGSRAQQQRGSSRASGGAERGGGQGQAGVGGGAGWSLGGGRPSAIPGAGAQRCGQIAGATARDGAGREATHQLVAALDLDQISLLHEPLDLVGHLRGAAAAAGRARGAVGRPAIVPAAALLRVCRLAGLPPRVPGSPGEGVVGVGSSAGRRWGGGQGRAARRRREQWRRASGALAATHLLLPGDHAILELAAVLLSCSTRCGAGQGEGWGAGGKPARAQRGRERGGLAGRAGGWAWPWWLGRVWRPSAAPSWRWRGPQPERFWAVAVPAGALVGLVVPPRVGQQPWRNRGPKPTHLPPPASPTSSPMTLQIAGAEEPLRSFSWAIASLIIAV